jgi:4,5-DOPA dioxygenase extradiol
MNLKDIATLGSSTPEAPVMPALFLGHGNPMNAITENDNTRTWRKVGESLPRPNAILCVSAHWQTRGTAVTAMPKPKTIHDFGGFPRELYDVDYPAPGSPELATATVQAAKKATVALDHEWGLDHGCWSVMMHLFPKADIPVVQLSLDHSKPAPWHYELAGELATLRSRGVLIVGSGNIVHNLRLADWNHADGFEWALEANSKIKDLIVHGDTTSLVAYEKLGREVALAVPTPEHYLPLLYVLALKSHAESVSFFNDRCELGSIAMTSLTIS